MKIVKNIYDRNKILLYPDKIDEIIKKGTTWPVTVNTGFTTYCNHSCVWCSSAYTTRVNPKEKGRDKLLINSNVWIENMKIVGKNGTKGLIIAGQGEPLLHPKANEMLDEISNTNLKYMIFSNGEKLNADIIKTILKSCIAIRFSVDAGTNEIHKKWHSAKNSNGRGNSNFNNVIENISNLVKYKKDKKVENMQIGCQMISSKLTEPDFEIFAKTFKDIGVDYIVYKSLQGNIINKNISLSSFDLHSSIEDRKKFADQMIEKLSFIKNKYEDKKFRVYVKVDQIKSAYVKKHNGATNYSICRAHSLVPMIEPDGKVYMH